MPGLLEGQIADTIYKGFKNKLLKGTLTRKVVDMSEGLDESGDPHHTTLSSWPCQGFVDNYSEYFRAQVGIPDTDLIVNIFSKSLPSSVTPQKDDVVEFSVKRYQLRKDATDPATALWTCQAFLLGRDSSSDCRVR